MSLLLISNRLPTETAEYLSAPISKQVLPYQDGRSKWHLPETIQEVFMNPMAADGSQKFPMKRKISSKWANGITCGSKFREMSSPPGLMVSR